MTAEQIELLRLCHVRTVANHESGERRVDHATLAEAHAFLAAHLLLGRPMSDGSMPQPGAEGDRP